MPKCIIINLTVVIKREKVGKEKLLEHTRGFSYIVRRVFSKTLKIKMDLDNIFKALKAK